MADAKELKRLGFFKERIDNQIMWSVDVQGIVVSLDDTTVKSMPISSVIYEFLLEAMNQSAAWERLAAVGKMKRLEELEAWERLATVGKMKRLEELEAQELQPSMTLYQATFYMADRLPFSVAFEAETIKTTEQHDRVVAQLVDDEKARAVTIVPIYTRHIDVPDTTKEEITNAVEEKEGGDGAAGDSGMPHNG